MISMIVPVRTTLPREEAWQLDDIAQMRKLRRSHIVRAMVRYVMQAHMEDFMVWLDEQNNAPVQAVEDPTPEEVHDE